MVKLSLTGERQSDEYIFRINWNSDFTKTGPEISLAAHGGIGAQLKINLLAGSSTYDCNLHNSIIPRDTWSTVIARYNPSSQLANIVVDVINLIKAFGMVLLILPPFGHKWVGLALLQKNPPFENFQAP